MKKEFGVDEVPKSLTFFETPSKRAKKSMETHHKKEDKHHDGKHESHGHGEAAHDKAHQGGKEEDITKDEQSESVATSSKRGRKGKGGGGGGKGQEKVKSGGNGSSSSQVEEEKTEEHHTKWEEVNNEANRHIVEMINEISRRYFKAGDPDKGSKYCIYYLSNHFSISVTVHALYRSICIGLQDYS
jgi:hypothetical protein